MTIQERVEVLIYKSNLGGRDRETFEKLLHTHLNQAFNDGWNQALDKAADSIFTNEEDTGMYHRIGVRKMKL